MPSRRLAPLLACALTSATGVQAQVVFDDLAPAAGVDAITYGRGAAMVDLDGDDLLDLVAANGGAPDVYLRQRPDRTFEDVTAAWGFPADDEQSWSLVVADLDGDADPDLFVGTGGFLAEEPNRLWRNDLSGAGVFTEVGAGSGVDFASRVFGATGLDHDLDGDLDLFVCETRRDQDFGRCRLLRNEGGLVFSDVSVAAGVDVPGNYRHCGAGDVDNDGWPDLGVGNYEPQGNLLLVNQQDGTFDERAASAGVAVPGPNFGMVFEEFDNDGWLDVFVPRFQFENPTLTSAFLLNEQDGTFRDVSAGSGATGQTDMGHNTHDVDADGHPDVLLGTGAPPFAAPDVLWLVTPDGQGGLQVEDVSAASQIGAVPTRSHGAAFGDYDGDGDVDVYVNTGGMGAAQGDEQANQLHVNQGNGRAWIGLDLRGVLSNRSAVGARVMVVTESGRELHRQISAGKGFGNTDAPTELIGLGDDEQVLRAVVRWPSGIAQTLYGPDVDRRHELVETGLRLLGTPALGEDLVLQLCGAGFQVSELIVGQSQVHVFKPQLGGVLGVAPPFLLGPAPVPLGADGRESVPFTIPMDGVLVGVDLYLQSWVHDAGSTDRSVLTNVVELTITS